MKFLIGLMFSVPAFAMDASPTMAKPFDLMKCKSVQHGTVWASYGRVMTSDKPAPTYFLTELAVFSPDKVTRFEFGSDFKRALSEIETRVERGGGSLHFTDDSGRAHSITWIQADRRDPNSFLGNWRVRDGGTEVNDIVGCTLL